MTTPTTKVKFEALTDPSSANTDATHRQVTSEPFLPPDYFDDNGEPFSADCVDLAQRIIAKRK